MSTPIESTQDAYERIRAWFTKPGATFGWDDEGEDGEGGCVYRGPKGQKCAVGCLIPDELYRPEIENNMARALIEGSAMTNRNGPFDQRRALDTSDLGVFFANVDLSFIELAQCAHDDNAVGCVPEKDRMARFIDQLDQLAEREQLQVVR